MYCVRCGEQLSDDAKFCPSCGSSTQTNAEQSSVESNSSDSGIWIFLGIISALVALFFFPPIFGLLGVFFGYQAKKSGNSAGGFTIMVITQLSEFKIAVK